LGKACRRECRRVNPRFVVSISARQLGYDQGRFDEAFFFTGALQASVKNPTQESRCSTPIVGLTSSTDNYFHRH